MKEKIMFSSVIVLAIFVLLFFLMTAFKKNKIFLKGRLSVKKNEQPILFWFTVLFYVIIILFFVLLLSFLLY